MTAELSKPGTVISFYSYKGGTGRSMALANAACLLAKEGNQQSRQVLMIDWDLEAPGLHRFFPAATEHPSHRNRPGIINYFIALNELLKRDPDLCDEIVDEQGGDVLSKVLPIDDYVIPDVTPGVDLILAGRFDSEYPALVGTFNWANFDADFEPAITAFRRLVASRYRYCLIDSRTGITDISGICTTMLPEKLVTVFTPNNQSLSGVINVISEAVRYRRASDDYRPLAIFPLPSRIDLAEVELRETWRRDYQKALENCFREAYDIKECDLTDYFDEVQLPHMSYYAYGERIAVLREERSEALSLGRAYRVFLNRLVDLPHSWEIASASLSQLRAPVADFVGREQEIETLINNLRPGSARIGGISGMGGVGKTELALCVAERLAGNYPDAQFFINLQGTDAIPLEPQQVLATCIRAFVGPEARLPEDPRQLSQLYLSHLNGKRVLLVLDNAANSAQVRPLLPPTGSALLVTSRQVITLPGMLSLTLTPLTSDEARELLLEIAPHAAPVADQICVDCGYLPLAIRAAGSLLAIKIDLNPVDYAAQLKDERNRLKSIGTEGVETGIEASFNLSYARLTPEAARVFRLLSVFPGSFDAKAEEVICDDTDHAQLSDFVRHSLVLYEIAESRYRLHNLARLFAETKLSGEERAVVQKHHADYYKNVLGAADKLYLQGGNAMVRGLALFDLEWNNIQTGHTWVASQDITVDEEITRLCIAYITKGPNLLDLRQHSRDRIRWLEVGLTAAKQLNDRRTEGETLRNLGFTYAELGEVQRAIQFHEQALQISRDISDHVVEAMTLGNLGTAYMKLGENERAIQFYEQQLTELRALGDRRGEGTALGHLGIVYRSLGETKRAVEFYEQHLVIARQVGDRRGEGNALGNLGTAYYSLGESRRAIQFYEQQLAIVREIGDSKGEGNALGGLAVCYHQLGELNRAVQFYEQQLGIVREIGDRRGEGTALWNMSVAFDQLGQRAQAINLAEQSLTIREEIRDPRSEKVRAQLAGWSGGQSH